jgi:hypothetical protein
LLGQAVELPKPDNIDAPKLGSAEYHRLAVAYGLSFSAMDLGKIVPPEAVTDILPKTTEVDIEQYYIEK